MDDLIFTCACDLLVTSVSNYSSQDGHCSVLVAVYNKHLEDVKLLLGDSADVNMRSSTGQIPSDAASDNENREVPMELARQWGVKQLKISLYWR